MKAPAAMMTYESYPGISQGSVRQKHPPATLSILLAKRNNRILAVEAYGLDQIAALVEGSGQVSNPRRLIISAVKTAPLRLSATIWGARKNPWNISLFCPRVAHFLPIPGRVIR